MTFQSVSESIGILPYFDNVSSNQGEVSYITYKTLVGVDNTMDTLLSVVSSALDKPWIGSLLGSLLVSLSGVFPMFLIHLDDEDNATKGGKFRSRLKA